MCDNVAVHLEEKFCEFGVSEGQDRLKSGSW